MIALLLCLLVGAVSAQNLQKYNVDPNSITVMGVSSGGYMAVQMHVAYSATFRTGVGVIAGGPYFCSHGILMEAEMACMMMPVYIDDALLINKAKSLASDGKIDPVSNMASSKVWLYSGKMDTLVRTGVVEKLQKFYESFVSPNNITFKNDIDSEHAWITDTWGNNCMLLMSPYINNCNYDASGAILQYLYGSNLKARTTMVSSNIISFSQSAYTPSSPAKISFGDTGYVYVPTACQNLNNTCKLTVAFHGCSQTIKNIGMDFINHVGINEWAEANNIIVLYPQAANSMVDPMNENGCFDWWAYTCSELDKECYVRKDGPQMVSVYNMVKAIVGF